jgi:hypothetical protein
MLVGDFVGPRLALPVFYGSECQQGSACPLSPFEKAEKQVPIICLLG